MKKIYSLGARFEQKLKFMPFAAMRITILPMDRRSNAESATFSYLDPKNPSF